jgi:hypothetical protein
MDALIQLRRIARALDDVGLEAIMIGNAAAALQGAPVTTVDFDFYFRRTPANVRKLRAMTKSLGGVLMVPFYPVSSIMRLEVDTPALQIDFMSSASGVRSLESLRSRAVEFEVAPYTLRLACLADIIRSKTAAGRAKDAAVLPVLNATLAELTHAQAPRQEAARATPLEGGKAARRKRVPRA